MSGTGYYKTAVDTLLAGKATLVSPALSGSPTAPTQAGSDSSTKIANMAAVQAAIAAGVVGLLKYRGTYNASGNAFPSTGGSGAAGAIKQGDFWIVSTGGTLGGQAVTTDDLVIAKVDTPGSTAGNWDVLDHDIGGGGSSTQPGLPSYAPTITKPWDASQAVLNSRPANLPLLTAKLAMCADNAGSVHVGFAGDSLLIGYDGAAYDRDRAIPRRFAHDVARMLGCPYITQGVTLAKASYADFGDRWSLTGTWTASGTNSLQNTTAGTATHATPDQCTDVEVYYHNAGTGFTYTVDGGAPVTVTPTGASTIGKFTASGLAYGFHTIVITFAASGGIVCGQRCWTPALNQIHVHNLALGGARANGGGGQQNWSSTSTNAPLGLGFMAPAMLTAAGITLDAIVIEAGDNDIFSGGEDAPTTITGLSNMHGYWSAVPTVLLRPYALPGTVDATADALAAAMMTLAESIDAIFASWDEVVGRKATALADGFLGADNLHETFPHQVLIAAYLADVLVKRTQATPSTRWANVVGRPGGRYKLIESGGSYPKRPTAPAGWVDYSGPDAPGDALDGDSWDDLP